MKKEAPSESLCSGLCFLVYKLLVTATRLNFLHSSCLIFDSFFLRSLYGFSWRRRRCLLIPLLLLAILFDSYALSSDSYHITLRIATLHSVNDSILHLECNTSLCKCSKVTIDRTRCKSPSNLHHTTWHSPLHYQLTPTTRPASRCLASKYPVEK
jgi:hypothetical protein